MPATPVTPATPFTVDYPRAQDDLQRQLQRAYERLNALQSQMPASQPAISAPGATVTQTAGATYTANEQAMLNSIRTDLAALKSSIDTILSTLSAYGVTKAK